MTALSDDLMPRFLDLRERRVRIRDIAAELGVTRGVIAHVVAKLGLQYAPADRPKPPPTPRVRPPSDVAPERARAGAAPLEPGHLLSWSAISSERWVG